MVEGKTPAILQVAINMGHSSLEINLIAQITGLTIEQIADITASDTKKDPA
ncbi:hypothetical protein [Synechococcus sp. PCC 7502]|uniref:hypothetical protein n=1 Tax=Synechococcus sp. PCC 7502 TaxID=1173263 RepID=UPI0002D699A1|nr:hypothetical protein [Synechococcus sp. PCC 7502]